MNPFKPTKFEQEKNPIIWLSKFSTGIKKDQKSVFISGTRGSGKTTILRSLSYKTIMNDQFLFDQHGSKKIHWVGQYLKFNANFQEYTSILEDSVKARFEESFLAERIFCAYFELSVLKFFLDDVLSLQRSRTIHLNGADETLACNELGRVLSSCTWTSTEFLFDFYDARRLVDDILGKFFEFRSDRDIDPLVNFVDKFRPTSILSFIKSFAMPSIRSAKLRNPRDLEFFILLDDCENLSESQQIALNSYLRRTEGEIKWVLCFLNERYNVTATSLRNTHLTGDDRSLLLLNDIDDSDFRAFCEKVTNSRVERYIATLHHGHVSEKHVPYTIAGKFGEGQSYNSKIDALMDRSSARSWLDFQEDVKQRRSRLANQIKKSLHPNFDVERNRPFPYVQHAVLEAFDIDVDRYATTREQRSLWNTIRGKQAAAYIAICAKYFPTPLYGGSEFVLAVSDRCIRDYLDLMGAFFDYFASTSDGNFDPDKAMSAALKFWRDESISPKLQDQIIQQISRKKLEDLSVSRESRIVFANLVHGFGELQACLERDHSNWRSIRQMKRGKFRVNIQQVAKACLKETSWIVELFHELEYDRYIKFHVEAGTLSEDTVLLSVHRRLRPYFKCGHLSPSGAAIDISATRLADLLTAGKEFNAKKWANEVYSGTIGEVDEGQLRLEFE